MQIKEQNAIKKNWSSDKIKIGLIYPNTYRVAMTSLGVQLLYFLFNSWDNFICERIFKPLNPNLAPYSLESQKSLKDFDILAVSCQFEHDFLQAIELLLRGDVNPDSRQRTSSDPLILLGGPSVTANPFPVLFVGDAFFLGDIEPVSDELMLAFNNKTKQEALDSLASVPGVIVRGVHFDNEGNWIGEKVVSVKLENITEEFYPIKQIIPDNVKGTKNEPIFGRAYYLETDRGCSERCQFCFVGNCRFPRVERSLEKLIEIIDQASEVNVFDKIVLYGSAIAQSGVLDELIEYIVSKGYEVSCSSFRADFLTERLLKALKEGKQRTLSIAPETGYEFLRFALNKKMTNEGIFSSVNLAWETGFRNLKLYMIYGFPNEPKETMSQTVEFVKQLRNIYFPSGKITISMNQFITKAHTPLQYTNMLGVKDSKEEQKLYKNQFYKNKNIIVSLYAPEWSIIQRILSLRDHRYYGIIRNVSEIGNTVGNWKKILKTINSNLEKESEWNYHIEDSLPWDNITHTLDKGVLISSYQRYLKKLNLEE